MPETSVNFGKLEISLAEAAGLISDLPHRDVGNALQQLKLRSYVLICHAAIEEYLEKLSLAVLAESLAGFEADGRIRDPLISVCSYYKISIATIGVERKSGDVVGDLLLEVFKRAINEHAVAIDGVHGIKTKDQDAILLPVGVRIFDFDRLLSQGLNSFGGARGLLAHGLGFKMVTPRAGLEATVAQLFKMLLPLDNMLCERSNFYFRS